MGLRFEIKQHLLLGLLRSAPLFAELHREEVSAAPVAGWRNHEPLTSQHWRPSAILTARRIAALAPPRHP